MDENRKRVGDDADRHSPEKKIPRVSESPLVERSLNSNLASSTVELPRRNRSNAPLINPRDEVFQERNATIKIHADDFTDDMRIIISNYLKRAGKEKESTRLFTIVNPKNDGSFTIRVGHFEGVKMPQPVAGASEMHDGTCRHFVHGGQNTVIFGLHWNRIPNTENKTSRLHAMGEFNRMSDRFLLSLMSE